MSEDISTQAGGYRPLPQGKMVVTWPLAMHRMSSIVCTREFVRNADYPVPLQTYYSELHFDKIPKWF